MRQLQKMLLNLMLRQSHNIVLILKMKQRHKPRTMYMDMKSLILNIITHRIQ